MQSRVLCDPQHPTVSLSRSTPWMCVIICCSSLWIFYLSTAFSFPLLHNCSKCSQRSTCLPATPIPSSLYRPAFDGSNVLHPREFVLPLSFLKFPPLFTALNPIAQICYLHVHPCSVSLPCLGSKGRQPNIVSASFPIPEHGVCKAELTLSSVHVPARRSSMQSQL